MMNGTNMKNTTPHRTGGRLQRAGGTIIVPISAKIVLIFTVMLLLSNFVTNYITISMGRKETMSLTNQLLVRELKEIYVNASNQFQIYLFSKDKNEAVKSLVESAERNMHYPHSWAAGAFADGSLLYKTAQADFDVFPDSNALAEMKTQLDAGTSEGVRFFETPQGECFGVYKYNEDWEAFIIVTATMRDLEAASNRVFLNVSIIIVLITIAFVAAGFIALRRILKYVGKITNSLYEMQNNINLSIIDLEGAPNDDVTYLGVSFNALSSTINNLLTIFRKFASKDVIDRAYQQRMINLEGEERELTILFTDIRSFTNMTETLGNDVIDLINTHYRQAIHIIHDHGGVVGSIIGDAVIGMYGLDKSELKHAAEKSARAVESAFLLQDAAAELRGKIAEQRKRIEEKRALTPAEANVLDAMMLNIGVGIDGGTVFYGTLGSQERMTSTVIGDNVNSAARLEGLTRMYPVPVVVSEYVKDEALQATNRYRFFEIDRVQVKGKLESKRIFVPLDTRNADDEAARSFEVFEQGLAKYYDGDWEGADRLFKVCGNAAADLSRVFLNRIEGKKVPEGWDGVWKMKTK
jgi:class 3 adenylate cyclase